MKRVNRAILRGEKLDDDCKKAKTLTNCSTESYLEKCINCEAFVDNAKPLGVE